MGDNLTTTAQQTDHLHDRPGWDCSTCGEPWPCAVAKVGLAMEFQKFPSVLAIYMAAQMNDAALDLTAHGTLPPPDLYERFLAWIPR